MRRNVPNRRFVKKADNVMPRTKKDWNQDKKIVNMEKKIRQLQVEPESKYFDKIFDPSTLTTGELTNLNLLQQGTTASTRVGNSILMTSLQYRYSITTPNSVLLPIRYRIIFFLDRQPNGLDIGLGGAAGTPAILNNQTINLFDAPYQYECNKRIKILADIRGVINPILDNAAGTLMIPYTKVFKGNHKLGYVTKYDANGGLITDINSNAISCYMAGDNATGLTITGGSRIYFKDS